MCHKPRLHEHQVPNPDSNLDHNLHGRGGLSPDLNPVCLRVNATSLDQDLDQNARVNGAILSHSLVPRPSLSLSSAITILEAGKKELALASI